MAEFISQKNACFFNGVIYKKMALEKSSRYELLKKSSVVVVRVIPLDYPLVLSFQLTSLPGEGPMRRRVDPQRGEMLGKFKRPQVLTAGSNKIVKNCSKG